MLWVSFGALEREVTVAEPQHLDLFFGNVFEKGGRAVSRLGLAQADAAEDDPPHDQIGHLCSEAQNRSAAADLDIVGVSAHAKQLQPPLPFRRKNEGQQARSP